MNIYNGQLFYVHGHIPPPLTLEYLGGGVRQEISENIPPDHVEYTSPRIFWAAKDVGKALQMPNFILDTSGYVKWIYIDQKNNPRMTSANSWSLKIFQKRNLTSTMEFVGGVLAL